MTKTSRRAIGAAVVVAALGAWVYRSWWLQPDIQMTRAAQRQAEASQRFQNWAYVARQKEIAPGEHVKLVVIPHPSGLDVLDTKCLIYTHAEFKTSAMLCPDVRQHDIEENE